MTVEILSDLASDINCQRSIHYPLSVPDYFTG